MTDSDQKISSFSLQNDKLCTLTYTEKSKQVWEKKGWIQTDAPEREGIKQW